MLKPFNIQKVADLSDVLPFIGLPEYEQEEFLDDINGVTWGDASFTVVNINIFWQLFIQAGNNKRIKQAWPDGHAFIALLRENGVEFINLEG